MREPQDPRPPGTEPLAGLPMRDYWKALMGATVGAWQEQLLDWARLSARMMEGKLPSEELMASFVRSGTRWFALSAFPWEWAMRASGRLPIVSFVIDSVQEAVKPRQVAAPVALQDAELVASELVRVGGPERETKAGAPPVSVLKKCVKAELQQDGRMLEVQLVDLGSQNLASGLYAGMVYGRAKGQADRTWQPLALVLLMAQLGRPRDASG
ncbi:hypothetical protein ACLESO_31695, partial [Pyxidicoccus sp. 3LG]